MCRWASMNPGMAVMPLASIVIPLAEGPPDATETIFPVFTTMDPRSITVPFATTMRAFVIVTSCAESGAIAPSIKQTSIIKMYRFMPILLLTAEDSISACLPRQNNASLDSGMQHVYLPACAKDIRASDSTGHNRLKQKNTAARRVAQAGLGSAGSSSGIGGYG